MRFRYQAVTAAGELVAGEMEADSQAAVIARLQGQGHVPIRADAAAAGTLARIFSARLRLRIAPSARDLALVTQHLATLLHAGLAVDRALELAQTVAMRRAQRDSLAAVADKVRGGSSLADAMASEPNAFPRIYVGMVRAGEAGASLDKTLAQLGTFLERARASREKVVSALIYPSVVLATGLGSVAMLFGFVVPRFRPMFEEAGKNVAPSARALLAASDLIQNYWWAMAGALLVGILVVSRQMASAESRRRWDPRVLRIPLVGDLVAKVEMARFARAFGTLLANGVAPLRALAITRETLSNTVFVAMADTLADNLKHGRGLAEPLAGCVAVPALAVQLVRVGEETARLDEMLLKCADIFDEEVGRTVERLLALLVPGITILLGVVVAAVIGSILTAVLSAYQLAM